MNRDVDKRAAALAACGEVRDGMRVGLGTGSTAWFAIAELGRRIAEEGLRIEAIATSEASRAQAEALEMTLLRPERVATLDLAIDGADEIDPLLRAVKGAGGAMLREKVVAEAAARMIVIADGSKHVPQLGAAPVPVEVLPFAEAFVTRAVMALGARASLRMAGDAPYRTDQGNVVLDCRFPALPDPEVLAAALSAIPGLLGHGLFVSQIDAAYVAEGGQVERIERAAANGGALQEQG